MPTGAEISAAYSSLSGRTFTRDQLAEFGLQPLLDDTFVNDSAKAGVRPKVGDAWYRYGDANLGDYGGMVYVTDQSFGGQAVGQLGSIGPSGEYGAYNARLTWNPDGTYTLGDVAFRQTANNASATLLDRFGDNLYWIGPLLTAGAAWYAAATAGAAAASTNSAGWVSAEGGAGYLGGAAADASQLASAGWVSAEGGAGYLGGQAADTAALAAGNPQMLGAGLQTTVGPTTVAVSDYGVGQVAAGAGTRGAMNTALTAAGTQLLGNAGNALLAQALMPKPDNSTAGQVQAQLDAAGISPLMLLLGIGAVLYFSTKGQ